MDVRKVKLADLREPEKNVRMHTETQLREYERSVRMFGQIRPILYDEDNIIRVGVGLYRTLLRMGWEEADAHQITGLTEAQKKKLMIADNKVFDLGIDDLTNLNDFISSLGTDLDVPGFDEDVLRSMVADVGEVTETVMSYGSFTPEEIAAAHEAGERREAAEQRAPVTPPAPPAVQEDAPPGSMAEVQNQRTVVCPHCGETICL